MGRSPLVLAARWAARATDIAGVGARARRENRATEHRGFIWVNLIVCFELIIFFFFLPPRGRPRHRNRPLMARRHRRWDQVVLTR